jgi:hypothetical protein
MSLLSRAGSWLRRVVAGLGLALLLLGVLSARLTIEGERELAASDDAFDRGKLGDSVAHARRAAVLYVPGAPHVRSAYQRLIAVATGAEAADNRQLAEQAWRAVRSAALETRHVSVPFGAELERANASIARLQARAVAEREPVEPEVAHREALRLLRRDDAPRAAWIAALLGGLAACALGLGLLAWRGIGPDGTLRARHAAAGLVLALAGAACWTFSVYRA